MSSGLLSVMLQKRDVKGSCDEGMELHLKESKHLLVPTKRFRHLQKRNLHRLLLLRIYRSRLLPFPTSHPKLLAAAKKQHRIALSLQHLSERLLVVHAQRLCNDLHLVHHLRLQRVVVLSIIINPHCHHHEHLVDDPMCRERRVDRLPQRKHQIQQVLVWHALSAQENRRRIHDIRLQRRRNGKQRRVEVPHVVLLRHLRRIRLSLLLRGCVQTPCSPPTSYRTPLFREESCRRSPLRGETTARSSPDGSSREEEGGVPTARIIMSLLRRQSSRELSSICVWLFGIMDGRRSGMIREYTMLLFTMMRKLRLRRRCTMICARSESPTTPTYRRNP